MHIQQKKPKPALKTHSISIEVSMKKQWQWIILLSAALTTCAFAGELVVRDQAVSGQWLSGTVVHVYGHAWVAEGTQLEVQSGVQIEFHTTSQFNVAGTLLMLGRADSPIMLKVEDGWLGFKFSSPSHSQDWNTLQYVVMDPGSGIAESVVNAVNSRLRIWNCSFQAYNRCIDVSGGILRAEENSFLTYGTYSHCVHIEHLEWADAPCDDLSANVLRNNLIQVDGTQGQPPTGVERGYGLYVVGSTDLCISDNKIQLYSMLASSCGVYFESLDSFGGTAWLMQNCIIAVSSLNSSVKCIENNANDSYLSLERVTMDGQITDPNAIYSTIGVSAGENAVVQVNTDIVVLSGPSPIPWSVGSSTSATIEIQYSLRWNENSIGGTTLTGEGDFPLDNKDLLSNGMKLANRSEFGPPGNSFYGIHEFANVIWDQEPLFARLGEVGIWRSHEQVELYYGLTSGSPCRDSGDPTLDADPDNTIADMGMYYFHTNPADDAPPIPMIPSEFAIQRAYPNPFNPTATIPFTLSNPGNVRVAVYDMLGRNAGTLVNGSLNSGQHTVQFSGASLASGVYLVNFEYNGEMMGVQRLILLK
jgi:hypothetical protein